MESAAACRRDSSPCCARSLPVAWRAGRLPHELGGKTLLVRGTIIHYEDAGTIGTLVGPLEEVICRAEFVDESTGKRLSGGQLHRADRYITEPRREDQGRGPGQGVGVLDRQALPQARPARERIAAAPRNSTGRTNHAELSGVYPGRLRATGLREGDGGLPPGLEDPSHFDRPHHPAGPGPAGDGLRLRPADLHERPGGPPGPRPRRAGGLSTGRQRTGASGGRGQEPHGQRRGDPGRKRSRPGGDVPPGQAR